MEIVNTLETGLTAQLFLNLSFALSIVNHTSLIPEHTRPQAEVGQYSNQEENEGPSAAECPNELWQIYYMRRGADHRTVPGSGHFLVNTSVSKEVLANTFFLNASLKNNILRLSLSEFILSINVGEVTIIIKEVLWFAPTKGLKQFELLRVLNQISLVHDFRVSLQLRKIAHIWAHSIECSHLKWSNNRHCLTKERTTVLRIEVVALTNEFSVHRRSLCDVAKRSEWLVNKLNGRHFQAWVVVRDSFQLNVLNNKPI